MSAYKSDRDQLIPEVDPIDLLNKNSKKVRGEMIQQRAGAAMGMAMVGMLLMGFLHLSGVIVLDRSKFPDTSFKQRLCLVWMGLLFASMPIALLAKFRAKFSELFSTKAGTPAILIGAIGLGILLYNAAIFFSRPYTGGSLNHATESWYFVGGWFLILWGIVFRK